MAAKQMLYDTDARQSILAGVSSLAAEASQSVLQGRQWTDPALEFDERPPRRGRQVEEDHSGPAERQQRSEHHEQHEGEVGENDEVGGDAVEHG